MKLIARVKEFFAAARRARRTPALPPSRPRTRPQPTQSTHTPIPLPLPAAKPTAAAPLVSRKARGGTGAGRIAAVSVSLRSPATVCVGLPHQPLRHAKQSSTRPFGSASAPLSSVASSAGAGVSAKGMHTAPRPPLQPVAVPTAAPTPIRTTAAARGIRFLSDGSSFSEVVVCRHSREATLLTTPIRPDVEFEAPRAALWASYRVFLAAFNRASANASSNALATAHRINSGNGSGHGNGHGHGHGHRHRHGASSSRKRNSSYPFGAFGVSAAAGTLFATAEQAKAEGKDSAGTRGSGNSNGNAKTHGGNGGSPPFRPFQSAEVALDVYYPAAINSIAKILAAKPPQATAALILPLPLPQPQADSHAHAHAQPNQRSQHSKQPGGAHSARSDKPNAQTQGRPGQQAQGQGQGSKSRARRSYPSHLQIPPFKGSGAVSTKPTPAIASSKVPGKEASDAGKDGSSEVKPANKPQTKEREREKEKEKEKENTPSALNAPNAPVPAPAPSLADADHFTPSRGADAAPCSSSDAAAEKAAAEQVSRLTAEEQKALSEAAAYFDSKVDDEGSLVLSADDFGPSKWHALALYLACTSRVQSLRLQGVNIDAEAARILSASNRFCTVRHITLCDNGIGRTTAAAATAAATATAAVVGPGVAEAVTSASAAVKLNVSDAKATLIAALSNSAAGAASASPSSSQTLTNDVLNGLVQFLLRCILLESLAILRNGIRSAHVPALQKLLVQHRSLIRLSLCWNGIEDAGAEALAKAIHTYSSALTDVDLTYNSISPNGRAYVAQCVAQRTTHHTLRFHTEHNTPRPLTCSVGAGPSTIACIG